MFRRFFVPLDGSERAEKAIPIAAMLARANAGTVILARVLVPPLTEEYQANVIAKGDTEQQCSDAFRLVHQVVLGNALH